MTEKKLLMNRTLRTCQRLFLDVILINLAMILAQILRCSAGKRMTVFLLSSSEGEPLMTNAERGLGV